MVEHRLTRYGTTRCPNEGVAAEVDDDGICSACGDPMTADTPPPSTTPAATVRLSDGEWAILHDWYDDEGDETLEGLEIAVERILADRAQPATAALDEPLTPEQRQRFIKAADAALAVRRAIMRLAGHATGHKKDPHGPRCLDCGLDWPCVTVTRTARPALDAVADLPSGHALSPADLRALNLGRHVALMLDDVADQPTAGGDEVGR